jgi:NAD(P) transhydrogenase subunit alpha
LPQCRSGGETEQAWHRGVRGSRGDTADFDNASYAAAGATIVASRQELWSKANVVFKVRAPSPEAVAQMRAGTVLVSFL